jgi:hypothetical protein
LVSISQTSEGGFALYDLRKKKKKTVTERIKKRKKKKKKKEFDRFQEWRRRRSIIIKIRPKYIINP